MTQMKQLVRLFAICALLVGGAGLAAAADMMKEKAMEGEKSMQGDMKMQGAKAMKSEPTMQGGKEMKSEMAMKSDPGMLRGAKDHHASGKIILDKGMQGHATLTLSDIKIDKVPDGYVYLTKGGDWRKGVELGKLEQFKGTVAFALPKGVMAEDYDTVVIWCRKFDVEIGRGELPGKTMMK